MPQREFSFVWTDREGEWSYCYGKCIFVSITWRNDVPTKLRFLAKPGDCTGFMPYLERGSGHVELGEDIVYFNSALVYECMCSHYTDEACDYFVWECTVDRVTTQEFPCEAQILES